MTRFVVAAGKLGVPRRRAREMQRGLRATVVSVLAGKTTGRKAVALAKALAAEALS